MLKLKLSSGWVWWIYSAGEGVSAIEVFTNTGEMERSQVYYIQAESLYMPALEPGEKALAPDNSNTETGQNNLDHLSRRHGLRTWSDITGKFSREAQFVSLSNGVVEIHLATGEQKSIPLEKLSKLDQEYATQVQKTLDKDAESNRRICKDCKN